MKFKTNILYGVIALSLCGCNNPVFDNEGDCDPHYYAKFVYDMNMEWADAFSSQVNSVELFVFNPQTGDLVKKFEEFDTQTLSQPGYLMPLDLKPGSYEFIAWCGLQNNQENLFNLPQTKNHRNQISCRLDRSYEAGIAFQDKQLHHLFHGSLNVDLPDEEGVHIYQVNLIKNTNNITISLQHVAGLELTADMFRVEMTEGNGHLNYDNSLLDDEDIQYRPWHVRAGAIDISGTKADNDEGDNLNFFMAELSTSRLMKDRDPRINIIDTDSGETVYSIPIVKWATTFRSQQFNDANNDMHVILDDQEYLDRENTYNIMLYLDSKDEGGWKTASIYINSWRVVTGGYEANY